MVATVLAGPPAQAVAAPIAPFAPALDPSVASALTELMPSPGAPGIPQPPDPLAAALQAARAPEVSVTSPVPSPAQGILPPHPPATRPHPADAVDPVTGRLGLTETDGTLAAEGPDLALARTYVGPGAPAGLFGPGWRFAYDQWLQMYADFAVTEHRGDGGHRTYRFVPDDPTAYVEADDGDDLIYYDLDAGRWEPDRASNLDRLVRVGPTRMEVRAPDGSVAV